MTSLSKLWIFLLTLAGGLLMLMFLLSPAQVRRSLERAENGRLELAQETAHLLLQNSTRLWMDTAAQVASDAVVQTTLEELNRGEADGEIVHRTAQERLRALNQTLKLSLLVLVDAKGRVLARVGKDEDSYLDSLIGYPLVADAVRGYRLDDLWFTDGALLRMAAAPVVAPARDRYVGAVLLGQAVTPALAEQLHASLGVDVAFLCGGKIIASSRDGIGAGRALATLVSENEPTLGQGGRTGVLPLPGEAEVALLLGLPGEASAQGAALALISPVAGTTTLRGTLTALFEAVGRGDLPSLYRGLPVLAAVMVGAFLLGLLLLRAEVEAPAARLLREILTLSGRDAAALDEGRYRGGWRKLAAAVNAATKAQREHGAAEAPRATSPLREYQEALLAGSLGSEETPPRPPADARTLQQAATGPMPTPTPAVRGVPAEELGALPASASPAAPANGAAGRGEAVPSKPPAVPRPREAPAADLVGPTHQRMPTLPLSQRTPRPSPQAAPHAADDLADSSRTEPGLSTLPLPDERRSAALRATDERRSAALHATDERRSAALHATDERHPRPAARTESSLPVPLNLPRRDRERDTSVPAGAVPSRPMAYTRPASPPRVGVSFADADPFPAEEANSARTLHEATLGELLRADDELAPENPTVRDIPQSLVQAAIESALESPPASFKGSLPRPLVGPSPTAPIASSPPPARQAAPTAPRQPAPPAPSAPTQVPSRSSPARPLHDEPTAVNGTEGKLAAPESEQELEAAFRQTYQEFVVTKQRCNEPVEGLTFEKFAVKLRQSREQIMRQHKCKTVRFHVYIKEGKAALKATPVAR